MSFHPAGEAKRAAFVARQAEDRAARQADLTARLLVKAQEDPEGIWADLLAERLA